MRQERKKGFSPNICNWENCPEVNRKIEDTRGGEQVCGLEDLNSVLSLELGSDEDAQPSVTDADME